MFPADTIFMTYIVIIFAWFVACPFVGLTIKDYMKEKPANEEKYLLSWVLYLSAPFLLGFIVFPLIYFVGGLTL